jgi:hypothetical protein
MPRQGDVSPRAARAPDGLLDRYYREGGKSWNAFPFWAFERYLREVERTAIREDVR